MRRLKWSAAAIVACLQLTPPLAADDALHPIPPGELRSGREFVSPATQAEQDDLSVNPGMLWVEQGSKLWHEASGSEARSCASCHGEPSSLRGVAARYPLFDAALGRLLNLEARIRHCRTARQKSTPLDYESPELLALTALVAFQSRGMPLAVAVPPEAQSAFAAGQALYNERQGQLDLSCAQCHEDNWGKRLRAERISQGHPNGFPTYRFEWQGIGSLHRRLRACFQGVRAEPFPSGSPEFVALELYLVWRAHGLAIETPAVRR